MKSNCRDTENSDEATERLLFAAEKLFAEKGFDRTSVRDITKEAKCNVAAINYHFGGKDNLYTEVFRHNLKQMREVRIASIETVMSQTSRPAGLEDLLRSFANAFLEPLTAESKGRGLMKLIIREMIDPRLKVNIFFDEMVTPVVAVLLKAMLSICPNLEKQKALMAIQSIVAQLVHAVHSQQMFGSQGKNEVPLHDLSVAVDHIVAFSAAGIRSYVDQRSGGNDE